MWTRHTRTGGRVMSDHDISGFRQVLDSLTMRERQVLEARCRGLSNNEVAWESRSSEQTIKNQVTSLLKRMISGGVIERNRGMDRICWCLGYEQALADIEARLTRKRAA